MGMLRSTGRVMLLLAIIPGGLFVICLSVWLYGHFLRIDLAGRLPPPGKMVDIGTHKLHINCSGKGRPVVLLESGAGVHGWSAYWNGVKARLPDSVRVCAYDRGGMGWSEAGPPPRNAEVLANELFRLLENSGEEPPYLIVGHSFGGTVALSFMEENRADVAGFVAVEVPTYTFMKWRRETRFILGGRSRALAAPVISVLQTAFSILSPIDVSESPYLMFTDHERTAIQDAGFRTRMIANIVREEPFLASAEPKQDLGSLPLVVIQGAGSIFASTQWNQNQQDLLSLSTNSRFLLVETAGHGVPSQAPEAVVEGIEWILRASVNE